MKFTKDTIRLLIIVAILIYLLFLVIYFMTHSPEVSELEFLIAVSSIILSMLGINAAVWSKIADLSREIGEIKGRLIK